MTEFLFLTAGDIHISDSNPRSRKDNYKETIIGKLDQLRAHAHKMKADAVLLPGDIYNIKIPIKNSHDLNRELIETFKKFKCPVYAIPGNHDLTADDLETLPEQPISVLFASGCLKNLSHEVINKKGTKVSLVGIPFIKKLELDTLVIPPKEDVIAQICIMHIYASPKGGMLFKERLYGYDELSVLSPDIFVLGHYHEDQGVQWVSNKCFVNLGSISRGSLSEERMDHKPKFGIIKITKEDGSDSIISVDSIPIDIKSPDEVFDIKKRDDEKSQSEEIQKYVEHLVIEASATEDKKITVEDHMKSMKVEKEVYDMVLDLIREASTLKK